jgi:Protein of unknown function (DUF742)
MDEPKDPRGALVRPYAVTRGRTQPSRDIAIDAMLVTTFRGRQEGMYAGRDKHTIAMMCDAAPQSLAEVAARMRVPLGVARVLVSDMAVDGLLALHEPTDQDNDDDRLDMLERVLSGLRRL